MQVGLSKTKPNNTQQCQIICWASLSLCPTYTDFFSPVGWVELSETHQYILLLPVPGS